MSIDATNLGDKVVLVTGASAGIGLATARLFAEKGARVIGLARRSEQLEALRREHGLALTALAADIRDAGAVTAALAGLDPQWRKIDVLVNNAGLRAGTGLFQEADPADWEAMLDTNVRGMLNVTHAVLPGMVERGEGHVINVGSNGVRFPYRTGAVYSGTKAAMEAISVGMRLDLVGTNVRTTHINPGLTKTDISLVRFGGDREKIAAHYEGRPTLEPSDVANCIVWAASLPPSVEIAEIRVYPTGQVTGIG